MAGWVEKRGENRWRLNVNAGTGADGRRKIYRKTVQASSEREAEKLLAEFAADVLRGVYIEPAKLTFKDFAERWVKEYVEVELAPKTARRYKECLARAVEALGHLKLDQVKPLHLVEFYTATSWFAEFLERHGLPRMKFQALQALRHTSAPLLIAEGISLKNVSRRLGHADTRTTDMFYTKALESVDKKAAEVLDNIILGRRNWQKGS